MHQTWDLVISFCIIREIGISYAKGWQGLAKGTSIRTQLKEEVWKKTENLFMKTSYLKFVEEYILSKTLSTKFHHRYSDLKQLLKKKKTANVRS